MKKFSLQLLLALIIGSFSTFGQLTCNIAEDYSSANGWTSVNVNGASATGNTSIISNPILIQNGTVDFNNVINGFNDTRVYRRLGRTLCNSWVADFDFDPNIPQDGRNDVGQYIFCLTAGTEGPLRDFDNFIDQDGISVVYYDGTANNDCQLVVHIKDGPAFSTSLPIAAPFNGVYQIRLERIDGIIGRLTATNTINNVVQSICFDIPETIGGLTHLQHANYTRSSFRRSLNGTLDNTCIADCQRVDECCFLRDITGPSEFCFNDAALTGTYSIPNDPNANYTWITSGATITSGQGTNQITVSFPTPPTGLSQATIQLIVECNCFADTLEKIVTISNIGNLNANFSRNWPDNGNIYTSVSLTANSTSAGITHQWFVYEGANCSDPTHPIANPTPILSGTGTTFTQNVASLNMAIGNCYVIVHTMSTPDGICPDVEFRRHMSPTDEIELIYNPSNNASMGLGFEEVNLYPNPVNSNLNVDFLEKSKSVKQIEIYNSIGERVYFQEQNLGGENTINVELFPVGSYILKISFQDNSIKSAAFIKE